MMKSCRVLPHEDGDGPTNMATDEALLDAVASDPSMAVVRTYGWSTPTLSLGYFQELEEAKADLRWDSVPIVRRPTGGGALWHHFEVTYAVVIPSEHPASRPSRTLYRTVHRSIVDRLRTLGLDVSRRGSIDPASVVDARPFLCFTDRDEEDIVFRNAKLVGSAQRRRSGAVLQHGSLLLARSSRTPELPGLGELATMPFEPSDWAEVLRSTIVEALGLVGFEDDFRAEERQRADTLRGEVYANPSWILRR